MKQYKHREQTKKLNKVATEILVCFYSHTVSVMHWNYDCDYLLYLFFSFSMVNIILKLL